MEDSPLTSQIVPLPAVPSKQRKTHSKNTLRRSDSHRKSRRNKQREAMKVKKHNGNGDDEKEQDEDEKEEVERKIEALQRIVPGGESLGVDKLFEETAGYIIALQCQLKAMRALTCLFEGFEKEKRKFGG
ncbi:hypothetical protein FEM48_Zijuj04G0163700 [Ziziphus jujuba var. spinosa]|uniref:Transcription factor PAR1-like n=1 Tax=Ziziphus jujuba var. spinosa TaxID=714518 RepID=A0A978VKX1_ZIZJJ|nr:hypothetical protein FEM48_Zijuj04G0163700 [Ziziphus jujuba var. spinosa]